MQTTENAESNDVLQMCTNTYTQVKQLMQEQEKDKDKVTDEITEAINEIIVLNETAMATALTTLTHDESKTIINLKSDNFIEWLNKAFEALVKLATQKVHDVANWIANFVEKAVRKITVILEWLNKKFTKLLAKIHNLINSTAKTLERYLAQFIDWAEKGCKVLIISLQKGIQALKDNKDLFIVGMNALKVCGVTNDGILQFVKRIDSYRVAKDYEKISQNLIRIKNQARNYEIQEEALIRNEKPNEILETAAKAIGQHRLLVEKTVTEANQHCQLMIAAEAT